MPRSVESIETVLTRMQGLYQRDPARFERLRLELIERTIEGFSPSFRQRARGLQFEIDARLSLRKQPAARLDEMMRLFWRQFDHFQRALNDPCGFATTHTRHGKKGEVCRFKPSRRSQR